MYAVFLLSREAALAVAQLRARDLGAEYPGTVVRRVAPCLSEGISRKCTEIVNSIKLNQSSLRFSLIIIIRKKLSPDHV